MRVFVPCDALSIALGADEVADRLVAEAASRSLDVTVVRNGSHGLFWLEPMVEVEVDGVRHAYGPIDADDVPELLDAGLLEAGPHRTSLGPTHSIPELERQTRLTFARVGVIDPRSLDDYLAHGGFDGLRRALTMAPGDVVGEIETSGLRGRGGAAFPTGIKWRTVLGAPATPKYVVANADEGDSGTFADRMVMEGDPFCLIEAMAIAAHAVGASHGVIYCRSEYPHAIATLEYCIDVAPQHGWLGSGIAGSGLDFDIEVRVGAGAYICGEETSMLESIEGKRGMVRPKPPLPALEGLYGKPTVVNNIITLASVPWILANGGAAYSAHGVGRSSGTLPVQLAGNIRRGGLVEVPFGITVRELIEGYGGGTASGRPARAVQIGGPLGAYFHDGQLDTVLDYEAIAAAGGLLGHGGVVVFDDTIDMAAQARFAMEFCAAESCGKCTPCRIGSTRGVELIDKIVIGERRSADVAQLEELCDVLEHGSLCALGGLTPYPVRSAMQHFPEDFGLGDRNSDQNFEQKVGESN
ncbi:MAG: formate dehydrogenase [Actinobacteria bacterium]|nr:formate dehydrogenase [Actinomycetota bacterium]